MSKFQLAILIIFGLCIVGGIIAFSVYKGSGTATTDLSIWGTVPTEVWNSWYSSTPIYQDKLYRITYTYVPESNFNNELVNAIAEGRGPDIVLAFHDQLLKNQGKLYLIPFSSFSQRSFESTFVDGANVLETPQGEIGIPLVVDPLVLYYNKTIFNNYSVVNPPQLWQQMYQLAQAMTIRDKKTGNILQAAIPMGTYSNVLYAKDILATMIMQAGGQIVSDVQTSNNSTAPNTRASINETFGLPYSPGNASLLYYTEFSNPAKVFYTWNPSLPDSLTAFAGGESAMFIGFASDLQNIKNKNPNVVFDVALLPQSTGSTKQLTFGRFLSLAVARGSSKWSAAFGAAFEMMSKQSVEALASILSLPPARRDSLATMPSDPFQAIFYSSAIRAQAWKDPDTANTDNIFENMIDSVTSGRATVEDAVNNAQNELQALIDQSVPTNTPTS